MKTFFFLNYNTKIKPIFKKWKQNDICINVFGIHVGPLKGANIYMQNMF